MAESIIQVRSLPGIKRDGTMLEGDNYVDGQWVRFQRGLPRKMGGYRSINKYLRGKSTALAEFTQNGLTYIHSGSATHLERFYIDGAGNTSVITDRTPTSGFTPDADNMWQFEIAGILSGGVSTNQLIAQVAPNMSCICNSTGGQLFYGPLLGTTPLTAVTSLPSGFSATGGIVDLNPYTFVFGNDGYIAWSRPNHPADYSGSGSGSVTVAAQKIVRALPLRGGPGNAPSGLFWAADALIRAAFIGGSAVFQFDTLSTQTSLMSSRSIIEYDGVYYWCGTDRFLMYNGVVREIPNNLNINYFFDNLNYAQRQKVFVTKVPRYGEIWWCYPRGNATDCTHAIIYNVREETWYDTELPNGGRSDGIFPTIFPRPLMTGVAPQPAQAFGATIQSGGSGYAVGDVLTVTGGQGSLATELTVTTVSSGVITGVSISNAGSYTQAPSNPVSVDVGSATFNIDFVNPYKFWVHEIGVNEVDGQNVTPIQSYFETAEISLPVQQGVNRAMQVLLLEPDFVQSGDMTVEVRGRANARAPEVTGDSITIPATASTPQEQVVFLKTQRRQMRFRFESNTLDGDYQMGTVLAHVQQGDGTTLG